MASNPTGRVAGAMLAQRTVSRTYFAPALRVIAKAPGLARLKWKGSYMAVRRGRVSGVLYVLWLLLAAKPAEAAVAARHRTAPANGTRRQETLTARTVQVIPSRPRLSFRKLYDVARGG